MGLREYVIRRLLLFIPTLIGVTLLIFAILQAFSPEQRATAFATSPQELQHIKEIIKKYHLDDPIHVQYYTWLKEVLRGNLGWTQIYDQPVAKSIREAMPASVELVMFAIPATILVGIYLGVKSAAYRDKTFDHMTRILSIIGWSLPTFWFALILIAIFYSGLDWFPVGRISIKAHTMIVSDQFTRYTGFNTIDGLLNGKLWITLDALYHLVLPVITITVVSIAGIIRVTRSSMLEQLSKGYIVTARAKGLPRDTVINKHARKNALLPVITIAGVYSAGMLTGLVITETVFDYYGLGWFAAHGAMQLDIPTVLAFALLVGIVFCTANLIVDIMYSYLDPRIRLG